MTKQPRPWLSGFIRYAQATDIFLVDIARTRQGLIATVALIVSLAPAHGRAEIGFGDIEVELQEFSTGLGNDAVHITPTDLVPLPDGSGRLVVATFNGVVRLLNADGAHLDSTTAPYLDTRDEANRWIPVPPSWPESGR